MRSVEHVIKVACTLCRSLGLDVATSCTHMLPVTLQQNIHSKQSVQKISGDTGTRPTGNFQFDHDK